MDPHLNSQKPLQSVQIKRHLQFRKEQFQIFNTWPRIKFNCLANQKLSTVPFITTFQNTKWVTPTDLGPKKIGGKSACYLWNTVTIYKQIILPLLCITPIKQEKDYLYNTVSKCSTVLCTAAQICTLEIWASATSFSVSNKSYPQNQCSILKESTHTQ